MVVKIISPTEEIEDAVDAVQARNKAFKEFIKKQFFGGKLNFKLRSMLHEYIDSVLVIFEAQRSLYNDLKPLFMEAGRYHNKKRSVLLEAGLMEEVEAMGYPDLPDAYAEFILEAEKDLKDLEAHKKQIFTEYDELTSRSDYKQINELKKVNIPAQQELEKSFYERFKVI